MSPVPPGPSLPFSNLLLLDTRTIHATPATQPSTPGGPAREGGER